MNKRLYVGNLDYTTTDKDLEELFSEQGTVVYSKVVTRMDGKSRGFGFVEMETEEEAKSALEKLDHSSYKNRTIVISEARQKEDRPAPRNFDRDRGSNPNKKAVDDLNYKLRKLRKKFG